MTNVITLADRHRGRLDQGCQKPDIEALLKIRDDLTLLHSILERELAHLHETDPLAQRAADQQ